MDVAVTTTTIINPTNASTSDARQEHFSPRKATDTGKLIFDLGLWLSGLESFLNIQNHSFVEDSRAKAAVRDWSKEFRLTHSTLLLCSSLTFQLQQAFKNQNLSAVEKEEFGFSDEIEQPIEALDISAAELFELSMALRDAVLLGEGLLRAAPLKFVEWTAWSNSLNGKLKKASGFDKLIKAAEKIGEDFLPPKITALLVRKASVSTALEADLKLVLPRIAKILKWLSVIEEIIIEDKPLKPTLLIFARIYEYIRELTNYINNRLLRYPNQEDEFYGTLDGAAYVASIELRKVYQHELINVTEIRPTPQARARIEASQGLLNDSFQQTLVGFARLLDPAVNDFDIFPIFREKLNASIVLRRDLWSLLQDVQAAEQSVETYSLENLSVKLKKFVQTSMRHLMYKDWETFERFVEEITRTSNRNDLTPILHRFGAYLETLFGQVKMRGVLANHPFEFPQK